MSSFTSTAPITVQQYLSFKSPPGFRDELIEGEIILSPDPKARHQEIAHRICSLLERSLQGAPYVARQRTNMLMPQDHSMPSPDVFVIDSERWKAAIAEDGYPQQSPQLAVEVISGSNTRKNVSRKTALYLKNGARAVWIVYPVKKIIEVFGDDGRINELGPDQESRLPPPLPQIELQVNDVFTFI